MSGNSDTPPTHPLIYTSDDKHAAGAVLQQWCVLPSLKTQLARWRNLALPELHARTNQYWWLEHWLHTATSVATTADSAATLTMTPPTQPTWTGNTSPARALNYFPEDVDVFRCARTTNGLVCSFDRVSRFGRDTDEHAPVCDCDRASTRAFGCLWPDNGAFNLHSHNHLLTDWLQCPKLRILQCTECLLPRGRVHWDSLDNAPITLMVFLDRAHTTRWRVGSSGSDEAAADPSRQQPFPRRMIIRCPDDRAKPLSIAEPITYRLGGIICYPKAADQFYSLVYQQAAEAWRAYRVHAEGGAMWLPDDSEIDAECFGGPDATSHACILLYCKTKCACRSTPSTSTRVV